MKSIYLLVILVDNGTSVSNLQEKVNQQAEHATVIGAFASIETTSECSKEVVNTLECDQKPVTNIQGDLNDQKCGDVSSGSDTAFGRLDHGFRDSVQVEVCQDHMQKMM